MKNRKLILSRSTRMLAAWMQGAPTTESFGGVTLEDLQASHDAIKAAEMDLKESLADADLKRSALENAGRNANSLQRKVYLGISVELGEDSELLGGHGLCSQERTAQRPHAEAEFCQGASYLNGGGRPKPQLNARRSKVLRPSCRYAPRPLFLWFQNGLRAPRPAMMQARSPQAGRGIRVSFSYAALFAGDGLSLCRF